MRPVRRDNSPIASDFADYADAKQELVNRLGLFCSYCERRIATNLAVEHIQPKDGAHGRPDLIGRWENFLLACVNCNSTKGKKAVLLSSLLLPDRDNTFRAFQYVEDGVVQVREDLSNEQRQFATNTLALLGLNQNEANSPNANLRMVALDRLTQRREAWLTADDSREDLTAQPSNELLRQTIVKLAIATGFFSIWLTVFENDSDMRNRLIDAFAGTRESGCFDPITTHPLTCPNLDALPSGGKI